VGFGVGMGMGFGGRHWELREQAKGERFDLAVIRRALSSFVPYRWQALGVAVAILVISILGVIPPILTQHLIDRGIRGHHLHLIIRLTAEIVALSLLSGLLGVWQNWMSNVIGQNVMADFRLALFRHLHRQPMQFFTQTKSGELVSRVTNDVAGIQTVVTSTLVSLLQSLFTITTTLVVMFAENWQLSVLALIVVPAFVLPTQRVGRIRQDLQRQIQQALARLTAQLTETLGVSGAMLVKAFAREADEAQRFSRVNLELRDLQVRQGLVGRWLFMWLGMFSSIGPALLWGYGGWLVIQGRLSVGVIVAFTAYLGRLYNPLSQLAQLHVNVLTSVALYRRIFALLDREPEIQDGPVVLDLAAVRGTLRFEDVWFAYPRGAGVPSDRGAPEPGEEPEPALRGVSLEVPAGSLCALVGPSGAGKTTLLHMVPRFHDPTRGRVLLDGHDLREFTLESLRRAIGLVPQEPFLFHDTVLQNLLYARPDATREEVEEACRAAQIHDVIAAMPDGYETVVGERGYRLSGGEKQRLAIARVLLRAPRIVLLDEATSSLDTLSERRIQAALETLLARRTALVIAHRLSTILAADRIFVLERGQLVDAGTHAELLARGGLYARLYREQFGAQGRPRPAEEGEGAAPEPEAAEVGTLGFEGGSRRGTGRRRRAP
jgi:ATP-binding cassette subfamily B protein